MHKRPENGMWLPTGGQLKTVIYVFPPRHKENKERKKKKSFIEIGPVLLPYQREHTHTHTDRQIDTHTHTHNLFN